MVRIKQRYILGELVFEDAQTGMQIETRQVLEAIRISVQDLYGDMGLATLKQNFISKFPKHF